MHHILDDYQYEIVHGFAIPLPIIIYSEDKGFTIFSSSKLFDEDHVPLEEGYMVLVLSWKIKAYRR